MKLGIELKIDVTKIDKSKLFKGKKGNYLTLKTFIDTEKEDQYKWQGAVSYADSQKGDNSPILGNAKCFWFKESERPEVSQQHKPPVDNGFDDNFDDDIPF